MAKSKKAQKILRQLGEGVPKMGDLKKLAKEFKKDHDLAQELWSTGDYYPRLLAVLVFDKKLLDEDTLKDMAKEMEAHPLAERNQLADWLLANQLTKDKKTLTLVEGWRPAPWAMQRRLYWYHQARLRWAGKTPPDNSPELLSILEQDMEGEAPEVQWAMNFTAGQIGIAEPALRSRCVALGERLGLYKDEKVSKGCTPSYLPEFIRIEVEKLQNA